MKRLTNREITKINNLHNAGLSCLEIARAIDRSYPTVRNALTKNKTKMSKDEKKLLTNLSSVFARAARGN